MKLRLFTSQVLKKVFLTSCSLLVCLAALAQLDNTVEVTNDAKPVVTDVKKMPVKTKPAETKVTHYTMEYAVQGQPLSNYTPEPLGDYESEAVWKGNKKGYVHLSGGVPGTLDGMAAYQFDLSDNDALTLDFTLKGFNGKAKENKYFDLKDWKSRDYTNRTALKYNHRFDNGVDLFVKGDYENQLFNYRTANATGTDKQHNVLGSVIVGLTPYQIENFTFDATAGVKFFSQNHRTSLQEKLGETLLQMDGTAAYRISDEHSAGIGIGAYYSAYGNVELDGITRLRFTPYYKYSGEQMDLKLGVFVSTKGHVAPDASLTYHITPKSDVYVKARGYEENNDFRHLTAIHPYFMLDGHISFSGDGIIKMEDAFHHVDAQVGYRFQSGNGLSGDLNVGFDQSKNHLNFLLAPNTRDGIEYPWATLSKNKCFYLNADFVYNYGDIVKVDARHRLNIESNKAPGEEWLEGSYLSPMFDMNWKADFKLMHGLYAGLDWRWACFSNPNIKVESGSAYERPNMVNLGASIRYTLPIELPLTVFVKGDNLLNQNYDRYFGYRHIGANFLGGFSFSF